MKIYFLGTGTSIGVPEMGCDCDVCMSTDAKDKRLRSSVMVEHEGKRILIDCGPDFRQQMLRVGVKKIDGVLITHEHYDHVGGIDDIRPFSKYGDVPIYAEKMVIKHLLERIPYCFGSNKYPGSPKLKLVEIEPDVEFKIGDVMVRPLRVMHGDLPILGFRMGRMAYLTDMKSISEVYVKELNDLDILIVNALHIREHPCHQNLVQAIEFATKIGATETYFVHMSHYIGLHADIEKRLPPHIHLAYDGLEIEI
ncbi:MAG TPA: MBL fold metallo-hydrolase [Bacteroidaceae bacterium]|nr:MBL fold metallo-hydrolase [Bacteroidaceae bacterium]